MSKKCVQCGHTLPDDASFCPHCTAVQTEKQEIKTPRRWKRTALTVTLQIIFFEPLLTVIVAVPFRSPLTTPFAVTVATFLYTPCKIYRYNFIIDANENPLSHSI